MAVKTGAGIWRFIAAIRAAIAAWSHPMTSAGTVGFVTGEATRADAFPQRRGVGRGFGTLVGESASMRTLYETLRYPGSRVAFPGHAGCGERQEHSGSAKRLPAFPDVPSRAMRFQFRGDSGKRLGYSPDENQGSNPSFATKAFSRLALPRCPARNRGEGGKRKC